MIYNSFSFSCGASQNTTHVIAIVVIVVVRRGTTPIPKIVVVVGIGGCRHTTSFNSRLQISPHWNAKLARTSRGCHKMKGATWRGLFHRLPPCNSTLSINTHTIGDLTMQNKVFLTDFRNPKIHADLMGLYLKFFYVHRNMNKYFRIAILEKEIMEGISNAMRLTIEVNVMKSSSRPLNSELIFEKTDSIRGYVENIRAFTTLLWRLKAISEGFFIDATSQIESISKQITGWQRFLVNKASP